MFLTIYFKIIILYLSNSISHKFLTTRCKILKTQQFLNLAVIILFFFRDNILFEICSIELLTI